MGTQAPLPIVLFETDAPAFNIRELTNGLPSDEKATAEENREQRRADVMALGRLVVGTRDAGDVELLTYWWGNWDAAPVSTRTIEQGYFASDRFLLTDAERLLLPSSVPD